MRHFFFQNTAVVFEDHATSFYFFLCRDFAAAKQIGANGLHGKSWPDLDMLPLGWLTDPGEVFIKLDKNHLLCYLIFLTFTIEVRKEMLYSTSYG